MAARNRVSESAFAFSSARSSTNSPRADGDKRRHGGYFTVERWRVQHNQCKVF
jgi:hypothetical protein